MKKSPTGIVVMGRGFKNFTNAYICIRLLRTLNCSLPIELWMWKNEWDPIYQNLLKKFNVEIRLSIAPSKKYSNFPIGSPWDWILKSHATLNSSFRHAIFLDADSFPISDPTFLLDHSQYAETGACFWPSAEGLASAMPEIWNVLGLSFRSERGFGSGQMVIDTMRHREPLEFALRMNNEADQYFHLISGDKDIYRFSWHKFGRPFSVPIFSPQILKVPGENVGVICHHDFEGNRLFQHRNMAQWNLLSDNPKIPGYLYEDESRQFLAELRAKWNGRNNWKELGKFSFSSYSWDTRIRLVNELLSGEWLLDDRRAAPVGCCGPIQKWSSDSPSKPWKCRTSGNSVSLKQSFINKPVYVGGEGFEVLSTKHSNFTVAEYDSNVSSNQLIRGLKCREIAFAKDSTLRKGASPEAYWWDLELENGGWVLYLLNEKGRVARMTRTSDQGWFGRWLKKPGGVVGLKRVETAFRFLNGEGTEPAPRNSSGGKRKCIHVANHAYGVGDAIFGLYAAAAMVDEGKPVVYHTRFARWLQRASHPQLSITETAPPKGTRDMDSDYAEQLRYAPDRVAWYAGQVGRMKGPVSEPQHRKKQRDNGTKADEAPGGTPVQSSHALLVNREVGIPRLDFPKYVILAPFAAWESRDWPEMHWRRLAWLLKEAGYEVVAMGTKAEAERMERTFNKSYAYWAIDHEPEWVMDAMLDAAAVIGLDSGMIHVAGLLGVPAVCIHSHMPPEFLFSHAPTVKSVTPDTGCVFCRWQEDRGFMEGCATACSAMAVVGPEAVMAAVTEVVEGSTGLPPVSAGNKDRSAG